VLLATLLVLAAVGWLMILFQGGDSDHMGMHEHGMGPDLTMGSAPLFFAMWVAMMAAMMFPAAAPMILLYARIHEQRHSGNTALFVAPYLGLWVLFGAIAFALGAGVEALVERSDWVGEHWGRAGGALLVLAGLYQLSSLKARCLSKCRSPLSFLIQTWRPGAAGAARMGLHHGVYCLGCCWLLFLVLVPIGVMNLAAMLVVTLLVFAEKVMPWGRIASRVGALVLILYGISVTIRPG
jgi:predicted metal-binding membrane protein